MNIKLNLLIQHLFFLVVFLAVIVVRPYPALAQNNIPSDEELFAFENEPSDDNEDEDGLSLDDEDIPQPVELNGDHVEFIQEENKFIAKGNVIVTRDGTKLTCDRLEYFRDTQVAIAEGNVLLDSEEEGRIAGEKMKFNFGTMRGEFVNAKLFADPFYGWGEKVSKVGDNHFLVENGYITTSDFDKPEYRIRSRKIDVYPEEKAVARHVRLFVGDIPTVYLPKYTQDLTDEVPAFTFSPGYREEWGPYLLTGWRYKLDENLKGIVHLDYRERRDIAFGVDVDYDSPELGNGIIRTYYLNERDRGLFRDALTSDRDKKFKYEWRHQWSISEQTEAIWQVFKLSDAEILKEYFEREFERDSNPETFFLLTHTLPTGTLSFRADARVNDFVSAVEKLPEIQYSMPSKEIWNTNLYFKDVTTFSNLARKDAEPSDDRDETVRIDSVNEISYPLKISIIETRPFVEGRTTFYSKTKNPDQDNITRGIFSTGVDLSTKFYKIFDKQGEFLGEEIDRLRHIITPSTAYVYSGKTDVTSADLDPFDSIDSVGREHKLTFSLENKLQTKREGENVDLLRLILGTDFGLQGGSGKESFGNDITADLDFKPTDWLEFFFDTNYDRSREKLSEINFDIFLRDRSEKPRWSAYISDRINLDADDVFTASFDYQINPKWQFRMYERIDFENNKIEEQEYTLKRDLHSWEVEFVVNDKRLRGTEILVIFTLKAFPEIGFDFGQTYERRRSGSNNN